MKVAVLGFGTVGAGVYDMLRSAPGLEPGSVLVRPGKASEPFQVTQIDAILSDPSTGAVVEAMGGIEPAFSYAKAVLRSGRHFVTSNKALVAAHGLELAADARDAGAAFLFSAACGGGVPILHNLSLAVRSDTVLSVSGILNGTTNYMLHAMQTRGLDYGGALKDTLEAAGQIESAAVITGPEGGFEPFEAELAGIMGLKICSMGPRIYRCETAPIAALSAIMYATGNM